MLKGMEFRIYPNRIQETIIQKTFGCSRVVYNSGLALRIEEYKNAEGWQDFKNIRPIGDTNGDSVINAADIVEEVNAIMGTPSQKFVRPAADINGDGVVNAADIVAMVNIIMNTQ